MTNKLATKKTNPIPPSATLFNEITFEQIFDALAKIADPDLVLTKLNIGRQELRKLETDDEISAALETRLDAVLSTPWHLEDADNDYGEWLWQLLENHIHSIIHGAWQAVPYGYSVMEAVYGKDLDGKIGLSYIKEKPLEWFEPKRDGKLIYTNPNDSVKTECDLNYKFFLTVRRQTYRQPYGEALLSRLYWTWFFRYNGWRFWMKFVERFADPLLIGQTYQPEIFVEKMQSLGYEAIVGVSRDETITAVTNLANGEFENLENALVKRIQKLILGQTLTSDVGTSGSYAAAKVHNTVRNDKRLSDIRLVSRTVQNVINALWSLNGIALPVPQFILADEDNLSADRAERDKKLKDLGLTFTQKYFLDRYDLNDDDFTITNLSNSSDNNGIPSNINNDNPNIDNTNSNPDNTSIDKTNDSIDNANGNAKNRDNTNDKNGKDVNADTVLTRNK